MALDFKKWFGSSSSDNTPTPSLGINLGAKDGMSSELEQVTKKIKNTSRRYTSESGKYKEIAAFNKKLSESYMQNLQAMVDVSRLLEQYANVFFILREEIEKMEKALGIELQVQDFQYLENMTKDRMAELTAKFNKEADDLKKLYSKYGKIDEVNQLDGAQKLVNMSVTNAGNTYKNLLELDRQSKQTVGGGLKLKKHLSSKRVVSSNKKNGTTPKNHKKEKSDGGRSRGGRGSAAPRR